MSCLLLQFEKFQSEQKAKKTIQQLKTDKALREDKLYQCVTTWKVVLLVQTPDSSRKSTAC